MSAEHPPVEQGPQPLSENLPQPSPAPIPPRRSARQIASRTLPNATPESELLIYDRLGPPEVVKDTDGEFMGSRGRQGGPSNPAPNRRKGAGGQPPAQKRRRKNGEKDPVPPTHASNQGPPMLSGASPTVEPTTVSNTAIDSRPPNPNPDIAQAPRPVHTRAPMKRIASFSSSMRHRSHLSESNLITTELPPSSHPPSSFQSGLPLPTHTASPHLHSLPPNVQLYPPFENTSGGTSVEHVSQSAQPTGVFEGSLEAHLASLPQEYQNPPLAIPLSVDGLSGWDWSSDWDFDPSSFGLNPTGDTTPFTPTLIQAPIQDTPTLQAAPLRAGQSLGGIQESQAAMSSGEVLPAQALQDFSIGMRRPIEAVYSEDSARPAAPVVPPSLLNPERTNSIPLNLAASILSSDSSTIPVNALPAKKPRPRARRKRPDADSLRVMGEAQSRNMALVPGLSGPAGTNVGGKGMPWEMSFYHSDDQAFLKCVKLHMGAYFMSEFAFPDHSALSAFRERAWDAASAEHTHSLVWHRQMSDLVVEHGGKLRSRMKTFAEVTVRGYYGLVGNSQSVLTLAQDALFDSNFIHREWTSEKQFGPFRNNAIPAVINETLFKSCRSEGVKLVGNYQPLMPVPTIALACAALHCALDELIKGNGQRSAIKFEGSSYRSIYETYLRRWALLAGYSAEFADSTQRWVAQAAGALQYSPNETPSNAVASSSSADFANAQTQILSKVVYD